MAPPSSIQQVSLLGPPEIHHQPPPTITPAASAAAATTKRDPFMDLTVQKFNNTVLPPIGFTENGSSTFLSTGNPCLDFFFHVVPDTPPQTLTQRLELAWKHDPPKTLKLLCNLRGVRGTGKSDKEGGYTAALWLHKNHPKTLACNVASFAEFGYYKDLLEILFRLLEGSDARKLAKDAYQQWKQRKEMWDKAKEARKQKGRKPARGLRFDRPVYRGSIHRGRSSSYNGGNRFSELMKETEPKLSREEKRLQRVKNVLERFNRDPDFKFLHERVSDYFALCLRSDMKLLSSGKSNKISLAAKWCPSLDSSYDVITLLCESIGRKVFPRDEYPEYQGVEEAHYAYRVRDRLRKEVLVPLRKALELPEVYMGANDWGSLPYGRVASVAMKTYKGKFYKHDEERFKEYLEKVKKGEAKIAAGSLLPHEIIASLNDYDGAQVAELQWKRMVDDMAKKGKLSNCMAICDVSGSMSGTPMEVSVALGVLVSELSEEPWKGKLITFSANPELQMVKGSSLKEKTEFVRRMEWGNNTDFQKVFDLLLQVAVNGKLKPEEMIKTLFVFSDMEFDQANATKQQYYGPPPYYNYAMPTMFKRPYYNSGPPPQYYNYGPGHIPGMMSPQYYNYGPLPYCNYGPPPQYYNYGPGHIPGMMSPPYYNYGALPYYNYGPPPQYYNYGPGHIPGMMSPQYYNCGALPQFPQYYNYGPGHTPGMMSLQYYGPAHGAGTSWETDYQAIVRKFTERGYGDCVPEIVFWNLRDSKATPVPSKQRGVALVSGYSKNLMTLFLEEGGITDPESVMDAAISGDEYKKLVVLD